MSNARESASGGQQLVLTLGTFLAFTAGNAIAVAYGVSPLTNQGAIWAAFLATILVRFVWES